MQLQPKKVVIIVKPPSIRLAIKSQLVNYPVVPLRHFVGCFFLFANEAQVTRNIQTFFVLLAFFLALRHVFMSTFFILYVFF